MKRRGDSLDVWVFSLLVVSLLPIAQAEEAFGVMLAGALLAGVGMFVGRLSRRNLMTGWVLNALALLAVCWLACELMVVGTPRALAFAHFLAIVGLLKCVAPRKVRDQVVILVITALLLVIGAIVSGSIIFAVALGYFLTAGVYTLLRLHFLLEAEAVASHQALAVEAPLPAKPPGLGSVAMAVTGGALAVGLVIFVLFPRTGGNTAAQNAAGWHLTGFSPRVSLGDVARILPSERTVMRVQFRKGGRILTPADLGSPYLRGITREVYAGGVWRSPRQSATESTMSIGPSDPQWPLMPGVTVDNAGEVITQHYWLEAGAPPNVFSLYVPVSMSSDLPTELTHRAYDQTLIWHRLQNIPAQFEVTSAVRPSPLVEQVLQQAHDLTQSQRDTVMAAETPSRRRGRHRIAPSVPLESQYSAQVLQLTVEITSRAPPPAPTERHAVTARAQAICDYLRSGEYEYTLKDLRPRPGHDPLDDFLFHRKTGHCEYFATAMAVMCQAVGLEARLVNGFRPSEFNEVGGFYVVRQSDAHSWVEVYVPGRDWVIFDATPPAEPDVPSEWAWWWKEVHNWLDYLQFAWAKTVVAYDADYRDRLLVMLQGWFTYGAESGESVGILDWIGEAVFGPPRLSIWQRVAYWFVLGLILLGLLLLGRILQRVMVMLLRRWSGSAPAWPKSRSQEGRFYYQWLSLLAERGLRKPMPATPLEFAGQVRASLSGQADADQLVQAFYLVEYGRRPLRRGQKAVIARLLRALRARPG